MLKKLYIIRQTYGVLLIAVREQWNGRSQVEDRLENGKIFLSGNAAWKLISSTMKILKM